MLRFEDDALDYQGFQQFLIQISIHFHLKGKFLETHETGGKCISQLTFGEMLENLVSWFRIAAASKRQPMLLFECPDAAFDPSKA